MLAALLLTGAAICTAAQSSRQQSAPQHTEQRAAPTANGTSNAPPAKHNARESAAQPAHNSEEAIAVHYFYEFKQPQFITTHIKIEHDAHGRGQITFERRNALEPITEPFQLSDAALERITSLWRSLNFLDSSTKYQSERQMAHLGTHTLGMKMGGREREDTFNWTNDRDAYALANEYRRAAEQAMFVFDIAVARENEPLNTPELMRSLETLIKINGLSDPKQLVPLLRDLSNDERIPLIARNHALRLIKIIDR
ncbi:MAG: hypothetical protein AUG51_21165 [Acidobacteria bacterium 13_1_20CM_3_53_8]|nr:MAG: hypothetical protein AUG51_21165 [Acidobacteria bacterium 13_1_20CM_3_53_8]